MAASDMRNRRHVQPLLTWSTNVAHPMASPYHQGGGPVGPPHHYPGAGEVDGSVQAGQAGPSTAAQRADYNSALLCRLGQETVQDIVARMMDAFQTLKTMQVPNGTIQVMNSTDEKKHKLQDIFSHLNLLFRRLRKIFDKCNENFSCMEYTHVEVGGDYPMETNKPRMRANGLEKMMLRKIEERRKRRRLPMCWLKGVKKVTGWLLSMVPLKDEPEVRQDDRKVSEALKGITEEHKNLVEQVSLKNRQIKEVIDLLRSLIWDINTMLYMRKS
ncbi:MED30 [Cordylochernes scorpioides]|uniref:Mediator of RNA polymerase II transcription subunit 30 n=1 Tax=Cordylochernes scorpioides TaxID=51811 RepID=A0ABY6JV75_9ARAC|nr:MED30 [Cordylochernes scorpioides]